MLQPASHSGMASTAARTGTGTWAWGMDTSTEPETRERGIIPESASEPVPARVVGVDDERLQARDPRGARHLGHDCGMVADPGRPRDARAEARAEHALRQEPLALVQLPLRVQH